MQIIEREAAGRFAGRSGQPCRQGMGLERRTIREASATRFHVSPCLKKTSLGLGMAQPPWQADTPSTSTRVLPILGHVGKRMQVRLRNKDQEVQHRLT